MATHTKGDSARLLRTMRLCHRMQLFVTPREAFRALAIACLAVAAWLALMLAYVLSKALRRARLQLLELATDTPTGKKRRKRLTRPA